MRFLALAAAALALSACLSIPTPDQVDRIINLTTLVSEGR